MSSTNPIVSLATGRDHVAQMDVSWLVDRHFYQLLSNPCWRQAMKNAIWATESRSGNRHFYQLIFNTMLVLLWILGHGIELKIWQRHPHMWSQSLSVRKHGDNTAFLCHKAQSISNCQLDGLRYINVEITAKEVKAELRYGIVISAPVLQSASLVCSVSTKCARSTSFTRASYFLPSPSSPYPVN